VAGGDVRDLTPAPLLTEKRGQERGATKFLLCISGLTQINLFSTKPDRWARWKRLFKGYFVAPTCQVLSRLRKP